MSSTCGATRHSGELGLVRRVESRFTGQGGLSLFRCAWLPRAPSHSIVLVHGFGEHCLRYDELGMWFAQRGFAIHTYDQRGHGRTPGPRGHVDRFSDYHDDLAIFLERVREEQPELPLSLLGHSLGGLVVASFLRERRPVVSSAALSGPLLSLPPDISKIKRVLARLMGRLAPRLSMDAGIDAAALSNDPEVVRIYREDPLVSGKISARHASEMFDAIERTRGGGGEIGVPMLIQHGADDPLCKVRGSEEFHASLPGAMAPGTGSGETPEAEFRSYSGLKHEIFNELDKERVFTDLYDWLSRQNRGPSAES